MKLSSRSVRTVFAFGLERRAVMEALGNSFQSAEEHATMKTPTNAARLEGPLLKTCVGNCQKLNGRLKE